MKHRTPSFPAFVCAFAVPLAACTSSSTNAPDATVTDSALPSAEAAVTDVGTPFDATVTDAPVVAALPCTRTRVRSSTEGLPVFSAPSAAVRIVRDNHGVPHVYGATDADAMYGAGYAQATDRLFQMDVMRRAALGTSAEVYGPVKLAQDKQVRMLDLARWGRESVDRLQRESPETLALVAAWMAGINHRISEINAGTVPLPTGFRATEYDYPPTAWTLDDVFAISHLILFKNAGQLEFDLLATIAHQYAPATAPIPLFRPLQGEFVLPSEERPTPGNNGGNGGGMGFVLPDDARERLADFTARMVPFRPGASNNWAVSAAHSSTGHPIVAGDPHQGLTSPAVFYMQHINSADAGGNLDVVGYAFAGLPGIHLGHNRHVAWTATTTYPDTMDLWSVPADSATITLGTNQFPIERCVETIRVKGMADVAYTVEDVPGKGVLLPADFAPLPIVRGARKVLFSWTGFGPNADAAGFFGMDRAASVTEFESAVGRLELGAFNWVFADATDIAYRVHVKVPDRGSPATLTAVPNALMDGTDVRTLWTGNFLTDAQLPHSRGGAQGFLSSANNDPFGFIANGRIDDDPFYYGVWFDPGSRASRIASELRRSTTAGTMSVSDMEHLHYDTYSLYAEKLLPTLATAIANVPTDPALASYRNDPRLISLATALATWDRHVSRDSSAAVVFEAYASFLARDVLGDDTGPLYDSIVAGSVVTVWTWLSETLNHEYAGADSLMQGGRDVLVMRALAETRDWLVSRFGSTDPGNYTWGEYHRHRFNPVLTGASFLDGGTAPTTGGEGTVSVANGQFFTAGMPAEFHEATSGAVYHMVATFDAEGTPHAVVNFNRGNSGEPGSEHWDDETNDWVNGEYHTLPFTAAEVQAAARETVMVGP